MEKLRGAITSVGGYVPEKVLTNKDFEKMVDTTDEWITARTGILERRILEEGKGTSVMAVEAGKEAIEKRGIDPGEIDLVICATVTPDHLFPATANLISTRLGADNAWGFDMEAACSGFLYGVVTAAQFIESGRYEKVLLVGADKMSAIVDYEDRSNCIIFGDGAGAVLMEPDREGFGLIDSVLKSDGSAREMLYMPAGGSVAPPTRKTVEEKGHVIKQDGRAVFKFAVTRMAEVSVEVMERNGLKANDVDWLVPHQANLRIIDATANWMNLDRKKVMANIQRYGNTTAATIPLCLWEWEDQLNKGDNLIFSSFGGGFTWGATYFKWAYDGG